MASLTRALRTFAASLAFDLPRIAGRALVVGSAPGAEPPERPLAGWTVMTINASQVIADPWGVARPDFTIIRPEIGGSLPADVKAREVLSGCGTANVIVSGFAGRTEALKALLASFDYRYERLCRLDHWQRQRLLYKAARATSPLGVGKLSVSSGIFGAALCLHLGARQVVMAGFSFTRHGHAYDTAGNPRIHIDEDALALRGLAKRSGAVFAATREFAEESGLPLWRG